MDKKWVILLIALVLIPIVLLVVLIIISVLAFFLSSLDSENTIPDSCILGDDFNCENHVVNKGASTHTPASNDITLRIRNQKGVPVTITEVVVTEPTLGRCHYNTTKNVPNGAVENFVLSLNSTNPTNCKIHDLSVGSKIKGDVTITWYATNSGTAFTKIAKGTFVTNVLGFL